MGRTLGSINIRMPFYGLFFYFERILAFLTNEKHPLNPGPQRFDQLNLQTFFFFFKKFKVLCFL
jgi:hypothetical protein